MPRVIVYNNLDPKEKQFFVQVMGKRGNGYYPCGVELELPEEQIQTLEAAIIDTTIRNPTTNKAEPYKKARFNVVRINRADGSTSEVRKAGRPRKEVTEE